MAVAVAARTGVRSAGASVVPHYDAWPEPLVRLDRAAGAARLLGARHRRGDGGHRPRRIVAGPRPLARNGLARPSPRPLPSRRELPALTHGRGRSQCPDSQQEAACRLGSNRSRRRVRSPRGADPSSGGQRNRGRGGRSRRSEAPAEALGDLLSGGQRKPRRRAADRVRGRQDADPSSGSQRNPGRDLGIGLRGAPGPRSVVSQSTKHRFETLTATHSGADRDSVVSGSTTPARERPRRLPPRGPGRTHRACGESVRLDRPEAVGAVDRAVHPRLEGDLRLVAAG